MNHRHWARRLLAGAVAFLLALTLAPSANAANAARRERDEFVKVGYFIQWGIYGRSFFVKNLEDNGSAGRLTHINYAFGNVAPDPIRTATWSAPPPTPGRTTSGRSRAAGDVDGVADGRRRRCPATSTSSRSSRPGTRTSRC